MKVVFASDIHLEVNGYHPCLEKAEGDILILAGDIHAISNLRKSTRFSNPGKAKRLFDKLYNNVLSKFKHVYWIPGNHEYYQGDITVEDNFIEDFLYEHEYENVKFANMRSVRHDDVAFIMTTLWTDMCGEDPLSMIRAEYGMNDYHVIKNGDRVLKPVDTAKLHRDMRSYIIQTLEHFKHTKNPPKKIIVATHHAPTFKSDEHDFKTDLSPAFCAQMDDVIATNDIHTWIHGHTHFNVDYELYDTRIVSSQLGYVSYGEHKSFKLGELEL